MKYFEYSLIGKRAAPVSSDARESKASPSSGETFLSVLKRPIKQVQVKSFTQFRWNFLKRSIKQVQVELLNSFKKANETGP